LAVLLALGGLLGLYWLSIRRHLRAERELQTRIAKALADIKTLNGLLPICAWCKKIRDDSGYWNQLEAYVHEHTQAEFSHGICPECQAKICDEAEREIPR
jgi:hypothetical protein